MTVKAFRLENFMAFADTGWIELRPITLLFGRNSSGKSAIIRALRLLRQNLGKPGDYTLQFTSEYGVDLGGYTETVHSKNTDLLMRFHFRCAVPEASDKVRQEINQWREQNKLPPIVASEDDTLSLALTFAYDPHREAELIGIDLSCDWQITDQPDSHTLLSALWLDQETRYEVGYDWRLDTDMPSWLDEDWQRTVFKFPNCFLPQIVDSPVSALNMAFDGVADSITAFLNGIEYIGPIRPEPQRVYLLDEIERQRWRNLEYAAFLDFLEGELDDEKLIGIDQWLYDLELGSQIPPPVRKFGIKDATVASIEIEEKQSELRINLKNTGFGASQVIPVVVQSVTARQRVKIRERVEEKQPVSVLIEQPELHLHPRAQAQLADMFVNEVYTIPNPLPKGFELPMFLEDQDNLSQVNFLLETHSEHLLLRLQRRLAETSMEHYKKNTEDKNYFLALKHLSIYFIDRMNVASNVEEIEIDEFGNFKNIPVRFRDFFSDDLREAAKLARIRLRRSK